MKDLDKLNKEIQNLLISAYEIGYWDRDSKLMSFNNQENKIEYLNNIINPQVEECELTLIDSVS